MAGGSGNGGKMTPMMKQYHGIRSTLPDDVLLLFRLGDFYEMFLEDAKVAAPILNVALTKRNGMPMCGVPHHAAEGYIGKLVKAGKRVALAEQTTEPRPGQIVERAISQVISAGTVADLNLLDATRHNYLAAVFEGGGRKGKLGLAYLDHTTGEFRVVEFSDREGLEDELARVAPSEVLYPDEQEGRWSGVELGGVAVSYDGYTFLEEQAVHTLVEHFKVQSLEGFGCGGMGPALCAAGAVFHYLKYQLHRKVGHLKRLQPDFPERHVLVDAASQRNLDLVDGRATGAKTLLGVLDRTGTPMGARKLREWILHPIRDLGELVSRQDFIGALLGESFLAGQIEEALRQVRDIERTVVRLSQGSGNARDLQALARSLAQVPGVRAHVEALGGGEMGKALVPRLRDFAELVDVLESAICDEPPA
ncbi:MAG: DNA mismatch repair protein MutS, partial [Verrucomicrobiales bacterium]|nr:DNA mismatch repair protein MutS [Verrucomicrobiales bacterium]